MTKKYQAVRAKDLHAEIRNSESTIAHAAAMLGSRLTLARNLMRQRVQRGLTQTELARLAGMSQPRIADIESAKGNPRLDTLDRLGAALGTTAESLLNRAHADRTRKARLETSVHLSAPPTTGAGWDDLEPIDDVVEITRHFPQKVTTGGANYRLGNATHG